MASFLRDFKTQNNITAKNFNNAKTANFGKNFEILITDKNGKLEIRDAAELEKILGN